MAEAQLELICIFSEALGTEAFTVDGDQLRSALVNILENAVDACLKVPATSIHRIDFGLTRVKGEIVFSITDNGVGMDSDTQRRSGKTWTRYPSSSRS